VCHSAQSTHVDRCRSPGVYRGFIYQLRGTPRRAALSRASSAPDATALQLPDNEHLLDDTGNHVIYLVEFKIRAPNEIRDEIHSMEMKNTVSRLTCTVLWLVELNAWSARFSLHIAHLLLRGGIAQGVSSAATILIYCASPSSF
jgi:hypothetical protein